MSNLLTYYLTILNFQLYSKLQFTPKVSAELRHSVHDKQPPKITNSYSRWFRSSTIILHL